MSITGISLISEFHKEPFMISSITIRLYILLTGMHRICHRKMSFLMHMNASIDNHPIVASVEGVGVLTGRFWITLALFLCIFSNSDIPASVIGTISIIPYVILGITTLQYNFDNTFGGNNSLPRPRRAENAFWDWPLRLEYDSAINLLSETRSIPRCLHALTIFNAWSPSIACKSGCSSFPHTMTTDFSTLYSYCHFHPWQPAIRSKVFKAGLYSVTIVVSSAKLGHVTSIPANFTPYIVTLRSWGRSFI